MADGRRATTSAIRTYLNAHSFRCKRQRATLSHRFTQPHTIGPLLVAVTSGQWWLYVCLHWMLLLSISGVAVKESIPICSFFYFLSKMLNNASCSWPRPCYGNHKYPSKHYLTTNVRHAGRSNCSITIKSIRNVSKFRFATIMIMYSLVNKMALTKCRVLHIFTWKGHIRIRAGTHVNQPNPFFCRKRQQQNHIKNPIIWLMRVHHRASHIVRHCNSHSRHGAVRMKEKKHTNIHIFAVAAEKKVSTLANQTLHYASRRRRRSSQCANKCSHANTHVALQLSDYECVRLLSKWRQRGDDGGGSDTLFTGLIKCDTLQTISRSSANTLHMTDSNLCACMRCVHAYGELAYANCQAIAQIYMCTERAKMWQTIGAATIRRSQAKSGPVNTDCPMHT